VTVFGEVGVWFDFAGCSLLVEFFYCGCGVVGVLDVDWLQVLSVSAVAALVSLLRSIGSTPFADPGTAGLLRRGKYAAE